MGLHGLNPKNTASRTPGALAIWTVCEVSETFLRPWVKTRRTKAKNRSLIGTLGRDAGRGGESQPLAFTPWGTYAKKER